jgi:hypothetical protein
MELERSGTFVSVRRAREVMNDRTCISIFLGYVKKNDIFENSKIPLNTLMLSFF